MSDEILDLELQLLLAKYGLPRLLQRLAGIQHISVEQLQQRMAKLATSTNKRKKSRSFSAEEFVAKTKFDSETKKAKTLSLAQEFERGRFLPLLSDALQFCAKHGQKTRAKSRREILPRLVAVLASLTEEDLDELISKARDAVGDGGSFARLADAIMRGGNA